MKLRGQLRSQTPAEGSKFGNEGLEGDNGISMKKAKGG
jgi:hypothetical protein